MPDTKITALAAITTVAPANDLFAIVDVSDNSMAASGTTKNITTNQILGAGGTATLASATITGDLTVDTNVLKVDTSNNRVGINNASPAQALDVAGSVYLSTNATYIYGKTSGGSATRAFGINAANDVYIGSIDQSISNIRFNSGGGDLAILNSTGLGVGGSPTAYANYRTLAVVGGSSGGVIDINPSGGVTAGGCQIASTATSTNINAVGPSAGAAASLVLQTGTFGSVAPRLTIDGVGNAGIGVTPSALANVNRLEIGGALSSNLTLRSTSSSTSARNWMVGANINAFGDFVVRQGNSQGAEPNSGTDRLVIDPSGNLLVGTTSAGGDITNAKKTVGGIFSSINGVTASTATATPVTLFASQSEATYMVSAYVLGTGAPATYNAVAIVKTNAGVATLTTISSATNVTISISGLNVQATQTSGINQVFTYNVIRIS